MKGRKIMIDLLKGIAEYGPEVSFENWSSYQCFCSAISDIWSQLENKHSEFNKSIKNIELSYFYSAYPWGTIK